MRQTLPYLKAFGLLIAAYLLFAVGSYLVPQASVERHVVKTIERGDLASDQPRAFLPRLQCRMDNFTDALILNQAYTLQAKGLIDGIMLVPRLSCGRLPFEELRVAAGVDSAANNSTSIYARYWHGNTFLARYLLFFWDYPTIRLFLYIISSLLMLWCGVLLWRRGGWQLPVAIGVGLLCSYVFVMQFSLQLSMVLFIALGGMIVVAKRRTMPTTMVFFVIGSLTAFFDLLTAPILTLGLPLLVMLTLNPEEKLACSFRNVFFSSLLWLVGYGVTWVSKWTLATLFSPENILEDGFRNLLNRSGVVDEYGRWDALMANLDLLPWAFVVIALLIVVTLACRHFNKQGWSQALPLLVVALIPWMWYLFAANHSYLHNWFTFRAQAVSIAAILLALMKFVNWEIFYNKHNGKKDCCTSSVL